MLPVYLPIGSAAITVPTGRGLIKLSFNTTVNCQGTDCSGNIEAKVTIPGNTRAQVCLPRYLFVNDEGKAPVRPCAVKLLLAT